MIPFLMIIAICSYPQDKWNITHPFSFPIFNFKKPKHSLFSYRWHKLYNICMKKPHIVIVGAGFGGVYIARHLVRAVEEKLIDVTIVSATNYFLFTPLLHEVATGGLRPTSVSEPLREIFKNSGMMIYQGLVTEVDMAEQKIKIAEKEISFDYLVIATGAETNYYGIPGARENTMPLKNLGDAMVIREKIINSFEMAVMSENLADKKRLLSFAVVGGGATGVETVAEVAEFVCEIRKKYLNKKYKLPTALIYLISSGPEILKPFNQKIRQLAEEHLREIGVNIMLGVSVSSVESGVINLDGRKTVTADTIIWAGGVTPTVPKFFADQPENVSGRLSVNEFLQMKNRNNVFVLGDCAWEESEKDAISAMGVLNGSATSAPGRPMLAQVAVAQSKVVAENIMASVSGLPMLPFVFKSKGNFISLGQWYAAGEIFGLTISGKIAWWVWRTVYLFNFASWEKRLKIAFEWSLNLFLPRDTTKLS